MTLELGEFAKRLEEADYKTGAKLVRGSAKLWEELALIPKQLPAEKGQINSLQRAIKEYKKNPTSPEKVTNFWQAFWAENGKKADISISVPECPFTSEQLKDMKKKNKAPIYISKELSTQENRHLLGKMFPKMQNHSVEKENSVTNEVQNFGWRSFDISIDAPYLRTTESQLKSTLAGNGEEEPALNEYIVAGQASKLLTGMYLDEGATASRILGSRRDGYVVGVCFGSGGFLFVFSDLNPGHRLPLLGGRGSKGVN